MGNKRHQESQAVVRGRVKGPNISLGTQSYIFGVYRRQKAKEWETPGGSPKVMGQQGKKKTQKLTSRNLWGQFELSERSPTGHKNNLGKEVRVHKSNHSQRVDRKRTIELDLKTPNRSPGGEFIKGGREKNPCKNTPKSDGGDVDQ